VSHRYYGWSVRRRYGGVKCLTSLQLVQCLTSLPWSEVCHVATMGGVSDVAMVG